MADDKNTQTAPDEGKVSEPPKPEGGQDQAALLQVMQKQLAESREANKVLSQKLDDIAKVDANKSGDIKKVLKLEQEAKAKLQAKYDELKSVVINNKIKSDIATKAKDAHNVDTLLKIMGTDKISIVDGNVYGTEELVKEARQAHPYLFKAQDVNAGPKSTPVTSSPDDKSKGYLEELQHVKTAKQLTDLQKKYNIKDTASDFNFGAAQVQ